MCLQLKVSELHEFFFGLFPLQNGLFLEDVLSSQERHVQPLLRSKQLKDLNSLDSHCNRRVHYFSLPTNCWKSLTKQKFKSKFD